MSDAIPIALLGSDLHLSHTCPVARMCESDWYAAMQRVLEFMSTVAREWQVPIILAGDIFHHYREPPELINFALKRMPTVYAVPGQHDLPYHNPEHVHKSAYDTMCQVGRIKNLAYEVPTTINRGDVRLVVHGFPWGKPLYHIHDDYQKNTFLLAVCHHYVWAKGHEHPGATNETYYETLRGQLEGFNLAHFGDNHRGFYRCSNDPYPAVLNTGTMMRRRMDEAQYEPAMQLLHSDGSLTRMIIPIDQDCMAGTPDHPLTPKADAVMDAADLMADLKDAGYVGHDFRLALRMTIQMNKDISEQCRRILREVLKDGD